MKNVTDFSGLENKLIVDIRTKTSCDYHRVLLPFSQKEFKPVAKVPVYFFNRTPSYGTDFLYKLKDEGVKIIMDIDDHYLLDPSHYLYSSFLSGGFAHLTTTYLKLADVVTVTTPLLASKLRHINRNIVVIPNALPYDTDQFTLSTDKESKTPIVWAGGASHYWDLREIQNISLEDKITFVGYEKQNTEWGKINVDHPRVTYEDGLPLYNYMTAYDGHEIAIAPLSDTEFNSAKSNLKILEAGSKGLPIICSKVEPYYNSIDKDFVIYADNKTEWQAQMRKLLSYKDLREDRGSALAEHVRLHYNLSQSNELRRQVIESFS